MGATYFGEDGGLFHKAPTRHGKVVPYAGLPIGAVELHSKYRMLRNDFLSVGDLIATGTNWTLTGTCTPALSDDNSIPYCRLTDGAGTDNAVVGIQWTDAGGAGEFIKLKSGKKVYFETAIRIGDTDGDAASVTQAEFFAGLSITDTTVNAGTTDFVGFRKRDVTDDSTNAIYFVAGKNASTSGELVDGLTMATGLTLDAAAKAATVGGAEGGHIVRLAMLIDGVSTAYVWAGSGLFSAGYPALSYVGAKAASTGVSTYSDDEELCLTYELKNGEAQAKTLDIFNYLVLAER